MCTNFLLEFPSLVGGAPLRVSARTLELAGALSTSLYLIPRAQQFPVGELPPWITHPLRWKNRFGFVGIASPQQPTTFMDGLNEKGLSAAALWLPGTDYPTGASRPQVAFGDFCGWMLGRFERVDELVTELEQIEVCGPGAQDQGYAPLHFIATDATGASVVIELVGGAMNVYPPSWGGGATSDGVLTNAPTYDWQRTNLQNYAHLSVIGPETSVASSGPPVGDGLLGMPGDPMSASRFVRAATMRKGFSLLPSDGTGWLPAPGGEGTSGPEQTAATVAMQLALVVMATPYGTVLSRSKPDAAPGVGDWTMWAVVRDHTQRKLYFTTAFNGIMRVIQLDEVDFERTPAHPFRSIALLPAPDRFAWVEDATNQFT